MTNWYREVDDGKGVERVDIQNIPRKRWQILTPIRRDFFTWLREPFGSYKHNIVVSTVFLALDHSWDGGPPVLYETMIFGGPLDQSYQRRYHTRADAIIGHDAAVYLAKNTRDY